jgi:hypothetical protein
VLGTVAFHTHALNLLLLREGGKTNNDLDGDWGDNTRPLDVSSQCTLLPERVEEAKELVRAAVKETPEKEKSSEV